MEGIGGWLLFFIISLTIINPISYVWLFSYNYDPFNIVLLIFSLTAGIFLWRKEKGAIKLTKAYLLTIVIVSFLGVFLTCSNDPSIDCAEYVGYNLLSIIVYPIIWNSYLNKSERVKNTYG